MSIPRMRTITEALAEIKMADAGSAVTANCIRTLCKNGQGECAEVTEMLNYPRGLIIFFTEMSIFWVSAQAMQNLIFGGC